MTRHRPPNSMAQMVGAGFLSILLAALMLGVALGLMHWMQTSFPMAASFVVIGFMAAHLASHIVYDNT